MDCDGLELRLVRSRCSRSFAGRRGRGGEVDAWYQTRCTYFEAVADSE
jgi:hypothetical protein